MTVEHVSPEQAARENKISADSAASIGNLMFVSESVNQKLGAKTWDFRRKALVKVKHLWIDPEVIGSSQWTEAEIKQRSERLADEAYKQIWAL